MDFRDLPPKESSTQEPIERGLARRERGKPAIFSPKAGGRALQTVSLQEVFEGGLDGSAHLEMCPCFAFLSL